MTEATWRELLATEQDKQGDGSAVVAVAPAGLDLDRKFDTDDEREHVLIWTEARVYFPVVYDGWLWIGSAPRNPVDRGQGPVGRE